MEKLGAEKAALEGEVAALEQEEAEAKRLSQAEVALARYRAAHRDGMEKATFEEKREALKDVAARVTIYPDRYELETDFTPLTDVLNPPSPRLRLNWYIKRQQKRGARVISPGPDTH